MRMEGYTSIAALIEGGVFYRCTTYRYGRGTNGLRMSEAKNYAVRQVPRDMSQLEACDRYQARPSSQSGT